MLADQGRVEVVEMAVPEAIATGVVDRHCVESRSVCVFEWVAIRVYVSRLKSEAVFNLNISKIKVKEIQMAIERTLSIIKPDAVAKNVIGQIYARFEAAGLKVVAAKLAHLSRAEAEAFYGVHKDRPFFKDLVDFMISGPVMIQALEGENAILKNRDLMGATDPKKAAAGTIRADFAESIDANAVHGSDALETAQVEIAFFFAGMNIYSR